MYHRSRKEYLDVTNAYKGTRDNEEAREREEDAEEKEETVDAIRGFLTDDEEIGKRVERRQVAKERGRVGGGRGDALRRSI